MKVERKKRIILLSSILFASILLTGCWDKEELNTIAISSVIGIERINDIVSLTMEVYNPAASTDKSTKQEEQTKYIQSTGNSFFDAIRNITMIFDKKIFFAHTKELIISEETSRDGFIDLLDLWLRQHQPWPNTYLLVSKDVSPADVIGIKSGIEDATANYIEDLIQNNKNTGKTVQKNVTDFLRDYYDKGSSTVGVISKKEKGRTPGDSKSEFELIAEGAAVFSDKKLVGFLNGIETRAMNFAAGKIKNTVIVSPSIDGNGTNSIEVFKAKRKIEAFIEGNQIIFNLKVNIMGILGEETGKLNTDKSPQIMKAIENQNSGVIKKEIEDVIKKAQEEYEVDIFGFGHALHSKYPEQWKKMKTNWNDIFSKSHIRVSVNTDIKNIGLLSVPLVEKEVKQ